jgi:hypothetical protein
MGGVLPNVVTYTAIIKGHLPFANDPKVTGDILKLLDRMQAAGVQPDVNTFVALLEGCARAG